MSSCECVSLHLFVLVESRRNSRADAKAKRRREKNKVRHNACF